MPRHKPLLEIRIDTHRFRDARAATWEHSHDGKLYGFRTDFMPGTVAVAMARRVAELFLRSMGLDARIIVL